MSKASRPSAYHHAFRQEYPGIVRELHTHARVILPGVASPDPGQFRDVVAIWDTGATNSVITERLVQALGLIPIGKAIATGVNSSTVVSTYMVDILLPNKVLVQNVLVMDSDLGTPIEDLLIGMDIIQSGDFSIANGSGKTVFSFAVPPFKNPTDLLEKANAVNPRRK